MRTPEEILIAREMMKRIQLLQQKLTPMDQKICQMRSLGFTLAEIGAEIDRSPWTVRVRLLHAQRRLLSAKYFKDDPDEIDTFMHIWKELYEPSSKRK